MDLQHGFLLGEWRVEPMLNRISNAGHHVPLEPQAMDVLCLLAQQAGQVVANDEIVRIAWAGRPISDNPVYKVINKLRRALGDNPREPRYLETLTKRGYRLIADVKPLPVAQALAHATPAPDPSPPEGTATAATAVPPAQAQNTRPVAYVAVALLLTVVLVAGLWLTLGSTPSRPLPQITPLFSLSGSSSQAAIARDGRTAFVNDSTGTTQLWLLQAAGTEPRQLTFADTSSTAPSWAPDGSRLLFSRNGNLWQLTPDATEQELIRNATNGAYAKDGTQIVFERGTEVWLASANGERQKRFRAIVDPNQYFAPKRPTFSPDGRHLAYFLAAEGPLGDIWTADLNSGRLTQLTFDQTSAGHPVYSADGQWIVFQSARSGPLTLWRVPSTGGNVELLLSSAGDDSEPAVSPAGQSIVYTSTRERWSLVRLDPANSRTEVLYDSRAYVFAPELSPDGKQLAFFAANAQRETRIQLLNLATRSLIQVGGPAGAMHIMPKWSSDGDWIYYYQANHKPTWRRVNTEQASDELMLDEWTFNEEHDTTIRPGGEQALFARVKGNEVVGTYIKDLSSGAELPFPHRITWADWSADGRSLVATEFNGRPLPVGSVVICNQAATQEWQCRQIAERGQHPIWGAQEESIYYAEPLDATRMNIWRYQIKSGSTHLVKELSPVAVDIGPFFDVDDNGRLLWVRHEQGRSELWRMSQLR